jgi:hypothetical protein
VQKQAGAVKTLAHFKQTLSNGAQKDEIATLRKTVTDFVRTFPTIG